MIADNMDLGKTQQIISTLFKNKAEVLPDKKIALANMTVATGENWIGNLSNKELKELFEVG